MGASASTTDKVRASRSNFARATDKVAVLKTHFVRRAASASSTPSTDGKLWAWALPTCWRGGRDQAGGVVGCGCDVECVALPPRACVGAVLSEKRGEARGACIVRLHETSASRQHSNASP